jgi:predicted esterase
VRVLALVLALLATPALAGNAQPETRHSEKGLEYSIRVPDGYEKWRGALLVVALHGSGEKQANFMRTMCSMKWLDKALIICPQAPSAEARWGQGDLEPVADLIREVQEEHHPPRTVLYGFSAGAFFSFGVGSRYADLVQAAIPHSGGLMGGLGDGAKKVAWYVIHGDADNVVNVEGSREAVKLLKDAGTKDVFYEELKGVAHTLDHPASQRAFEWVAKTLGPCPPELAEKDSQDRLTALEKAIKVKDWDTVAKGFDGLVGVSPRGVGKLASLAKGQLTCTEEAVAVAAARAFGRLGEPAIGALKTVTPDHEAAAKAAATSLAQTGSPAAAEPLLRLLEGKSEGVASVAAKELGYLGGDPAIGALVTGLQKNESSKTPDDRKTAINSALKRLTGQSFETSKDWKRWLASRGGK